MKLSNIFFGMFGNCRPTTDFLALFFGERGPPSENIDRDLHFAPVVGPFWPLQQILKNRDLEFCKISNIGEIDRIYPEALARAKPSHRTIFECFIPLMSQALHIKSILRIFVLHFGKTSFRAQASKCTSFDNNAGFLANMIAASKQPPRNLVATSQQCPTNS